MMIGGARTSTSDLTSSGTIFVLGCH